MWPPRFESRDNRLVVVSVFDRWFAGVGLGLPTQFGSACPCGLGALLGTNELFFCFRERVWSFGGRRIGVGVRHWANTIAGARAPRRTLRSGLPTENHVITSKSLAGWRKEAREPPLPPHRDLLRIREFSFRPCQTILVRFIVAVVTALIGVGVMMPPTAAAGPTVCDYPACTPGIAPNMVLGAPCDNTTYYAFGVSGGYVPATQPGRLMFCGSPRRYQPRWFRSPPMAGIKEENADCHLFNNYVAQAPDGLFLVCIAQQGRSFWTRADT